MDAGRHAIEQVDKKTDGVVTKDVHDMSWSCMREPNMMLDFCWRPATSTVLAFLHICASLLFRGPVLHVAAREHMQGNALRARQPESRRFWAGHVNEMLGLRQGSYHRFVIPRASHARVRFQAVRQL